MCGIAGIIYADQERPVEPDLLKAMGNAIAHRGPDAEGFWSEPGVGLVHRRLSIIDLEGGDQPIGNEDGSIQVVFNGEIYNYRELRRGLKGAGTASGPGAIPRSSSTFTRSTGRAWSIGCEGCSRSRCGIGPAGSCCWPAIGWA